MAFAILSLAVKTITAVFLRKRGNIVHRPPIRLKIEQQDVAGILRQYFWELSGGVDFCDYCYIRRSKSNERNPWRKIA
jgi:hypothetical protein